MKKELTPEQKEQIKETKKLWYLANKERLLVKAKEYRENEVNKQTIKKTKQDWYKNNKEIVKENVRNWRNENNDLVKEYNEKYYINNKKIASIGLKVRKGCSYHGISLNINNAIDPFFDINPCGYDDLQVTTLSLEGSDTNVASVSPAIASAILDVFGFTALQTNIDNPNSRSKR